MIKAIIFDLDGTLLNTIEDIHCVLNESLAAFALPQITLPQAEQFIGNGARKLVECAVGDRGAALTEKVYAYYSARFAKCENERTKLYGGEEEALRKLKERGVKLAIVTNKPQRATDNVYGKFLSKFDFCEVLGQTEYYSLKPDPASTLAILDKLNLSKEECVFVGDGEMDVICAKRAGIRCISALWGYRSREQLAAAGAEEFAVNFDELMNFIG